ncbi:hypothetical protein [Nonomuraea jabiensis]|uniref:hypothetical protein n=1 Tax=Nonomuraea jabiensis TaxID=882448 RepID=UPI003D711D82
MAPGIASIPDIHPFRDEAAFVYLPPPQTVRVHWKRGPRVITPMLPGEPLVAILVDPDRTFWWGASDCQFRDPHRAAARQRHGARLWQAAAEAVTTHHVVYLPHRDVPHPDGLYSEPTAILIGTETERRQLAPHSHEATQEPHRRASPQSDHAGRGSCICHSSPPEKPPPCLY